MTDSVPATKQTTCVVGPAAKPFSLGRRASFWTAGAVVAHTLWTSTAPALTCQLYAAAWQLSHAITTAIVAVYPIVVVAVLIGCGDIPTISAGGRRSSSALPLPSPVQCVSH